MEPCQREFSESELASVATIQGSMVEIFDGDPIDRGLRLRIDDG
jgi:hypothetical protein